MTHSLSSEDTVRTGGGSSRGPADIAIVGVGCRFPGGVKDLPSLWTLLLDGVDVIDDVPRDRWAGDFHSSDPKQPGTTYCPVGGFLEDIDRFDAEFFKISPREARDMDPQQRMLLEVSWEAVEDAGLTRTALEGSETGVYMGILGMDYTVLHSKTLGVDGIGPYFATGKEFSFGSGRVSYVLGLHGPSMMVNTACSSSLVATHLACQSLLTGECDVALAGGVNAVAAPELNIFLSKAQAMSPTGRCKPFDAAADGIVRGEGCGVVVLKRLDDAVADGDRVLGVILGSAMNHDGQSAGLTVPSMSAQEALVRRAMKAAAVSPEDVSYVEAHGTGTPLGDPIEMGALGSTLGAGRSPERPLVVGSLKANFGHMDSAAGIAGLLKALLVVRNRTAPPQLHLNEPNPRIAWDKLGLTTPQTTMPVGDEDRPLVAGVSAFGLSGTNAHLILRDAPETAPKEPDDKDDSGTRVLVMSASSKEALRGRAAAFHELVQRDDAPSIEDLTYTAAARRTHHSWRLAVCGDSHEALAEGLAAHLQGEKHPAVHKDAVEDRVPPPVLFAFSGQGSQWPGMGADLYDKEPVVRETLDECDALFREHADWSLLDELRDTGESRLRETEIAQPAIFAIQLAVARLWQARGVEPAAVVGHSMGEIAAACFAGALSLPDAARLIVSRGRLMQAASGSGRMAAVECSPDEAREVLDDYDEVCVATVNGPRAIVIAGSAEQVTDAVRDLKEAGRTCTALPVDYAFHSPAVREYGDELETLLDGLTTSEPDITLLSSVDAGAENPTLDAAYWGRNVREPVDFWSAVDRWLAEKDAAFVEIGPHPTLSRPLSAALVHRDRDAPVVTSLRRGRSGEETMAAATARLHVGGVPIAWERIYAGATTALPVHEWAGSRYWLPGVDRGHQGGRLDTSRLRAEVRLYDESGRLVSELSGDGAESSNGHGSNNGPTGHNGHKGSASNGQSTNGDASPKAEPVPASKPAPAAARQGGASAGSGRERLSSLIQATLADLLEWEPGTRVPRSRGFYDLGLDSVATMELSKRLSADLGHEVGSTDLFDHPSVNELARHILKVAPDAAPAAREDSAPERSASAEPAETPAVTEPAPAPARPSSGAAPGEPEPIAIVGIGCRLPKADSPEGYWKLLRSGADASSDLPEGRWDAEAFPVADDGRPGAVATRRGSFIDHFDEFDNAFFRISAREARSLDPQQRLFMEVAWDALQDAGIVLDDIRGGQTGVFVGLNTTDYQQLVTRDPENIDLYYGTGNSFSGAAGRLSYFLGVRGPSIAVDTACSSSLTAVHLACQSLLSSESEIAIAGGANIMATPTVYLSMSSGALSADGRCKTFDDSADGYGRGEGAGVIVLKRLSTAVEDGDQIYAVIPGSAVNQDGASGGLTVPSGDAQREVIGAALARARLNPAEVDYVEAHGTGTHLGDAIELRALDGAFGSGREADRPLLVGSAKTNIGHLEAAAGVAGLIKVLLAMRHEEIPPHIHLSSPTSQVQWDRLRLKVPTETTAWRRNGHARTAGISAFGFTGTNAHIILREYDAEPAERTGGGGPYVLPLSAATPTALRDVAERMADRLEETDADAVPDVCYTAAARRSHLEYRLAVVADSPKQLVRRLRAVADGDRPEGCHLAAEPSAEPRRPAFVYGERAGDLPWSWLLENEPAFEAAVRECDEIMVKVLDLSPVQQIADGTPDAAPGTVLAQHVGLTALWRRWGVRPDAAVGHGTGELSAAWAAGALTLAQAVEVLAGRDPAEAREPDLPLFSATAGGRVTAEGVRDRVTDPGAEARPPADDLVEDGLGLLVDVGAGLSASGTGDLVVVRGPGESAGPKDWATAAAEVYVSGATVGWERALGGRGRVVSLPNYPWERRRHWIDIPFTASAPAATPQRDEESGHPLLGRSFTPPDQPEVDYRALIVPGAEDHTTSVGDVTVVSPGTLAEAVAAAGGVPATGVRLRDVSLTRLVPLPEDGGESGQLRITRDGDGRQVELFTGDRHAAMRALVEPGEDAPDRMADGEGGTDTVQATAAAPYRLSPRLLDETLRLLAETIGADGYPVAIGELWMSAQAAEGEVTVRTSRRKDGTGRAQILTSGRVVAELNGVRFAPAATLTLPPEARERLDERLYDIVWERVEPPEGGSRETGRWLVYAEERELGERVAAALRDAGQSTVTAGAFERPDVTADSPDGWTERLTEIARDGDGLRGVVHLVAGAPDADPGLPEALNAQSTLLRLCQALAELGDDQAAPLRLVTSGAKDPVGDTPVSFTQAAAWELGRVFAMDSPAVSGGLIDLDPSDAPGDAAGHAVAALLGRAEDDQLCVRRGEWHAARLRHAAPVDPTVPVPDLRPDRWHLVVGGLEAGGAPVVDWLVDHGAKLLLLSASPGSEDGAEVPEGLADDVRVRVVDPGERFEHDLDEAREEAPLGAVCFAVTPASVRPFNETSPDAAAEDVRRAALAARADRATRDDELDAFVLCRSAAPSWGSVGSAVTATADAWINALAAERRFSGHATQLISWMPRADTDELSHRDRNLMEDSGLTPLSAADVREAFDYLVRADVVSATVAIADEAAYVKLCQAQAPRTFLDGLSETSSAGGAGSAPPLAEELLAMPEQEREDRLTEELLTVVGEVLGDDDDIGPDKGFFELGMDSVMSLSLKTRVERALGCELPTTLTFEFPTTAALVRHLLAEAVVAEAGPEPGPGGSPEPASAPPESSEPEPAESLDDDELLSRLDAAMSKSESMLGD